MSLFLCLLIIVLISYCNAASYNYYVSTNGSDTTGDGSISKPWATIQNAQTNVQKLITTLSKNSYVGNITVNIDGSGGTYKGPLTLSIADSMSGFQNNNYIIYKSTNQQTPASIIGAEAVTSSWTKSTKNGLNLYHTNLKPQQSQLPSNGEIYSLFLDDERVSISKSNLLTYDSMDISSKTIKTNNKMIPNIADIVATNYSMNLMVLVYEHWTSSYHYVQSIQYDSASGKIVLTLHTSPNLYVNDAASGNRFYLLNNMNLLSMNNEFYFNKTNLDLYLLTNTTITTQQAMFAKYIEIVRINGASATDKVEKIVFNNLHLKYSNIDFSGCFSGNCMSQSVAFLQTATVHTINVDDIVFDGVNVSGTGGYGIWFDQGTTNAKFINGKVQNVGAGGIRIGVNSGGVVSESSLTKHVLVSNNYILDGGYVFEAGCGVLAQSYAYSNITNNEIGNFKYTGISTGWTWSYETTSVSNNIIKQNMIYNIGQHTLSDMACIYTLGTQQNCLYDNNICHDVYSYNYGGWGTYTDQASRFLKWTNNIAYNTKCAGHHQHFGLDNIFLNNIYAFNELDEGQHDGGVRSSQHAGTCNYQSNQGACSSFTFITNIVYTNNTWGYDILGDSSHTFWKNISLDGNTYWSVKQHANLTFPDGYSITQWTAEGKDVQHALADPMFVDPNNYNFDLKPGSPAIALGFHQIDTENVGPNW